MKGCVSERGWSLANLYLPLEVKQLKALVLLMEPGTDLITAHK